jgi:hypothetical protein
MTDRSNARLRLTFEEANAICREFVPIGDQVFNYMTNLRAAGFHAFLPRHEFIESFAENAKELEIHRRCVVEEAKNRLGVPHPMRFSAEELKGIYRSSFIQQLEAKRDEANGVPRNQLERRYSVEEAAWRLHYDPCLRRKVRAGYDREEYKERFEVMLAAERAVFEQEVESHHTGLGRMPHTFDQSGRYAFFSAVMQRDAAAIGFCYDKPKSRQNYPVISKPISRGWDLCWAIEDARSFFRNPLEGQFAPSLELRGRDLCGPLVKVGSGEFLHIRYAGIVPGFFNGYWKFLDLDQLETAIKAHLHLYGLTASTIEGGIQKVLGKP